jgi:hypothetical protein
MDRFLKPLPSFNAVAAGATATLNVPTGPIYREIRLDYQRGGAVATPAQIDTDLDMIRVLINGVVRQELTGTELGVLQQYYGLTRRNADVPLFFGRPWMRTPLGEDAIQLGTGNVDTVSLEIAIDAAAVTPVLEGHGFVEPRRADLGAIIEVHRFSFTTAAAGTFEISTLPRRNGALCALHLNSAAITGAAVKLNDIEFSTSALRVLSSILFDQGRVPQANWVHFEPMLTGRIDDVWALANLQDFRVLVTVSGATTVNVVMETINQPFGPSVA